jgi:protein-S-isoprenylcysteine O-methyltransferase Ste14
MSSTFLTAHAVKSVLTRLYERKNSKTLNTLAPSIANLVYIVGLRVALESLSIQSVAGKWIEGAIYILAVIILIRLINKAALLGIEFSLSRVENSKTLRQGFLPLVRETAASLIGKDTNSSFSSNNRVTPSGPSHHTVGNPEGRTLKKV